MEHTATIRTAMVAGAIGLALLGTAAFRADASSHREAPFVTEHPRVDGTDFYMFRSYEPGRQAYVTFVANYYPLEDAYGGPNYFDLDPDAQYWIHIDSDGDSLEDIGFGWDFEPLLKGLSIPVGPGGTLVPVPLKNIGPIGTVYPPQADPNLNLSEVYKVKMQIRGFQARFLTNLDTGSRVFAKPADNVGLKSIPDYNDYARDFVYDVRIPGCGAGRLFAGQRREGFGVNLGEVFDLVNTDPVGDPDGENSATFYKNVTTLAVEVPIACLTRAESAVVGAWTTSTLPRTRTLKTVPTFDDPATYADVTDRVQVSRLGMPLVNEVVIGLPDKDRFNASRPENDLQFATYVTNPTLPELLEILFGVSAPNNFPRNDLLATFVTGIPGVNEFGFGEMQRLNTDIPPTPKALQNNLGVAAGDNAGFPNGRRPGDDVVDAELRVAMGLLCHLGLGLCNPEDAPSGLLPFTDGVLVTALQFEDGFPYLRAPVPGSPNSENGIGEK